MKSLLTWIFVMIAFLFLGAAAPEAKESKYAGVKGCTKACHKKERDGDQRSAWKKSKHSQAFQTLGTDKAKTKAKKLGVTGDPQKSQECLVCHTTGWGEKPTRFKVEFNIADGVQCEACHGVGEKYRKKKVMRKILKERGADRKGTSSTAKEFGLIFPGEKDCKRCHVPEITLNGKTFKNPSFKEFVFEKRMEKIQHRIPDKQRKAVIEKS